MVALDSLTGGVKFGRYQDQEEFGNALHKYINYPLEDLFFMCIGTDRSTGDSFGPLVGMLLKEQGYTNVIGCIDDPVHGMNLDDKLLEVPKNKVVIAIDATLGRVGDIGTLSLNKGKLSPGAGVGKQLTKVGDYNIQGVVNASGFMEFVVLQNTRLSLVMQMAKQTSYAIQQAFPLTTTSLRSLEA